MKKIFLILLIIIFFINTTNNVYADKYTEYKDDYVYNTKIKVFYEKEKINLTKNPILFRNNYLLPLRNLSEKLDKTVIWHNNYTITIYDINTILDIEIDSKYGYVSYHPFNSREQIVLNTAPILLDETTYIPIEVFANLFGYKIDFDINKGILYIKDYDLKIEYSDVKTNGVTLSISNVRTKINNKSNNKSNNKISIEISGEIIGTPNKRKFSIPIYMLNDDDEIIFYDYIPFSYKKKNFIVQETFYIPYESDKLIIGNCI